MDSLPASCQVFAPTNLTLYDYPGSWEVPRDFSSPVIDLVMIKRAICFLRLNQFRLANICGLLKFGRVEPVQK